MFLQCVSKMSMEYSAAGAAEGGCHSVASSPVLFEVFAGILNSPQGIMWNVLVALLTALPY